MLRLYNYFRSSAAYRVRIALNLKNLPYESIPVHLLNNGGEQHGPAHRARNPAELVPVLEDGTLTLTQSIAIIEYLEQLQPEPPLLPTEAAARAWVRALALSIACDIHPLCNLRVLQYLESLGLDSQQRKQWSRHWITLGLGALEHTLVEGSPRASLCCYGDTLSLADCCLIPQVFNAQRIDCPLQSFPTIARIYAHCMSLSAFQRAAPGVNQDAQSVSPLKQLERR